MPIPFFIKEIKQFFTQVVASVSASSISLANVQPLKVKEYAFIAGAPQVENAPQG
ncbi:hypothetical protein SAMN05192549_1135 [Duganella sacchari]|uniref:Uncharacterized protein n=1 Tax=Duganella sacchari TaxID=551987 RepID=A0A1M7R6C4_9BURK|nr:hypothetical protein [Duganella sacchari]SHN41803.1 hypothetical protein SAMN05192549_1135 [Duganella sacchari]